jgi:hypothetical protein
LAVIADRLAESVERLAQGALPPAPAFQPEAPHTHTDELVDDREMPSVRKE